MVLLRCSGTDDDASRLSGLPFAAACACVGGGAARGAAQPIVYQCCSSHMINTLH